MSSFTGDCVQLRANRRLWENKAKEVLKMSPQQLKNSNTDEDDDNNAINETFAPANTNTNDNNNNNNNNNNDSKNNDNKQQFNNNQQHNSNSNNNNNSNNNKNNMETIMQHQQQQHQQQEDIDHNNIQYEDVNDVNMLQQTHQRSSVHLPIESEYRKPKDIITIRQQQQQSYNTQALKESI